MINRVTRAHLGPIWYHIEPSDVPYSPNQFLGWDFFCCFHFFHNLNLVHIQSKLGLVLPLKEPNLHQMIKLMLMLNPQWMISQIFWPVVPTFDEIHRNFEQIH